MQEVLITSIRTDASVQSREKISVEYVQELVEQIKAGKRLPPVDVYRDGEEIWMADGWHRLLAHQEANKRTIRAEVHKGGRKEARWHSVSANQSHGLRRTNEDKRRCVKMALEDKPEMSDQAIADHVGVSVDLARSIRRQVYVNHTPVDRVGVDGKTYRIPPPPSGSQRVTPPPPPGNRTIPPPPKGPAPRIPPPPMTPREIATASEIQNAWDKAETKPKKEERFDENAKPIPDHLWPLWDRGEIIREMAADVTRLSNQIRKLHDEEDPVILDGDGQSIIAALETAKGALKANIPHAVCPYCHGKLSSGCRFCKGRGIIGEFKLKQVPRELRA